MNVTILARISQYFDIKKMKMFQLFSEPVYTEMKLYADRYSDPKDSKSTQVFSESVSKLVHAMMSQTPKYALCENSNEYHASNFF